MVAAVIPFFDCVNLLLALFCVLKLQHACMSDGLPAAEHQKNSERKCSVPTKSNIFLQIKFSRATSVGNIEAVIKLGISYLYNEGGMKRRFYAI